MKKLLFDFNPKIKLYAFANKFVHIFVYFSMHIPPLANTKRQTSIFYPNK